MLPNTKRKKIKLFAIDIIKKYNLSIPIDIYYLLDKLKLCVVESDNLVLDGLALAFSNEKFPHNSIIIIKKDRIEERKRFTISHEIYHSLKHASINFYSKSNNIAEREANVFAAELLMPEKEVKSFYFNSGIHSVYELSNIFFVSKQAMEIRLEELKII